MEDKDWPGDDALTKRSGSIIQGSKSGSGSVSKCQRIRNTGGQAEHLWNLRMTWKTKTGQETMPCRRSRSRVDRLIMAAEPSRHAQRVIACSSILFFARLMYVYNVNAVSFTCGDCNGSSMSSEMGASLQPYCRLAVTDAFCLEFYKASENSDIQNGSIFATLLQAFYDSCILP